MVRICAGFVVWLVQIFTGCLSIANVANCDLSFHAHTVRIAYRLERLNVHTQCRTAIVQFPIWPWELIANSTYKPRGFAWDGLVFGFHLVLPATGGIPRSGDWSVVVPPAQLNHTFGARRSRVNVVAGISKIFRYRESSWLYSRTGWIIV